MLEEGIVLQSRYRIMEKLGGGGMGEVYLAHDTRLADKPCAVKQLIPDPYMSPEERGQAAEQFHQEAAILAHLRHVNLPQVYDYFEEEDVFYLVMEYIQGENLSECLKQSVEGLPQDHVLGWALQLCDVLDYLHNQAPPIVFRDLKPGNVMVDEDGTVKLIDFGIARLFDPAKQTDTLKMGTAGYAPPEQYAGQGQTSPRSDIYSLGVTLYELLTGDDPTAHPFVFTNPRNLRPDLSPRLAEALLRAVSLNPEMRFPSTLMMKIALEEGATPRKISWPLRKLQIEKKTSLLPDTEPVGVRPVAVGIFKGIGRILGVVTLALILTTLILVVLGAFVLSLLAEQTIANADWDLTPGTALSYVLTEAELSEGARMAIEPYALDALRDVRIDFTSPNRASLILEIGDISLDLQAQVSASQGIPVIMLERINQIPLYVVGGIISNGMRRGFERAWEGSSFYLDTLEPLNSGIQVELAR